MRNHKTDTEPPSEQGNSHTVTDQPANPSMMKDHKKYSQDQLGMVSSIHAEYAKNA